MWFPYVHTTTGRGSLSLFDSLSRKQKCCLVISEDGAFLSGKRYGFQASIPAVLKFYECCLRRRQHRCLKRRDRFCKQHSGLWGYDREMHSVDWFPYYVYTMIGRLSFRFLSVCVFNFLVSLKKMSLFPSIFFPFPFSLCMESTPYVFPFGMVFFYITTTGWIIYFSLCENSIIQSNQIRIGSRSVVMCFRKTGCSLTGRGMASQVSIPHVLLFRRRCCFRRRQQYCLEGRNNFC